MLFESRVSQAATGVGVGSTAAQSQPHPLAFINQTAASRASECFRLFHQLLPTEKTETGLQQRAEILTGEAEILNLQGEEALQIFSRSESM